MIPRGALKSLALGIGLCLARGVGVASAQTVWLTHLAPGSNAELILGPDKVASGTADDSGLVQLAVQPAKPGNAAASMRVYVEECGNLRRVILGDSVSQPPPTDSLCQRFTVPELFEVRSITTLVVDGTGSHTVLVRQGPAFKEWLHPVLTESGAVKSVREPLPTGFMLSGGVAGVKFSDVVSNACGDATSCSGSGWRIAPAAAATLWFNQLIAAEVAYMQPQDVTTSGTGTNLTFTNVFQSRIASAVGKIGVQAGFARLYAMAGGDYAITSSTTTQTVVASTIGQGGTQTFGLETRGLGLVWGGGMEAWLSRRLAIIAEGGRATLKGSAVNNGQGSLDDALVFATVGARFRIGL